MIFEWDEDKNQRNIWKHGINFYDATRAFAGVFISLDVTRSEDLEPRTKLIGYLWFLPISVVFTARGERTRIISARAASRSERQLLEEVRRLEEQDRWQ